MGATTSNENKLALQKVASIVFGGTKQGTLTKITCLHCNVIFEGHVGTETIKGPSPTPTHCKKCSDEMMTAAVKNMFRDEPPTLE
jgi:hypothetical protein